MRSPDDVPRMTEILCFYYNNVLSTVCVYLSVCVGYICTVILFSQLP